MQMKLLNLIAGISTVLCTASSFAQTQQPSRPLLPFLSPDSQSNVVVAISDVMGGGQACPPEYINRIFNTNLFTIDEQRLIKKLFTKYQNVRTNSGPEGTELASFCRTNIVVRFMNRSFTNNSLMANFRYTNSDASEEVRFNGGMSAKFRDKFGNGYLASFTRTGNGTLFTYSEIKDGKPNGLLARFADQYPQGMAWDYKRATFTKNSPLVEYRQYTNGMVLGKYLVWNPQTGNLVIEANFTKPYDLEKYRTQNKNVKAPISNYR